MNKIIDQDQIEKLAEQFNFYLSDVESNEGVKSFYIDRDVPKSSLYNLARVVVDDDHSCVKVECCLLNGKGKLVSDVNQSYSDLSLALEDVHSRFTKLHHQFVGTPSKAVQVNRKQTHKNKPTHKKAVYH